MAPPSAPRAPQGGIAIVRGNLAPDGAVIKRSAASPALLRHRGPAVVFDGMSDLEARFDEATRDVGQDAVLVLRGVGPRGAPGMPEWGMVPIPEHLVRRGVTDMVRLSDARMSGTAFGTVVLHVAPESAAGGPLGIVRNGDPIELDVDAGTIHLGVPADEIERRQAARAPWRAFDRRGYRGLYVEHVTQADTGCDFDFLRRLPGEPPESDPGGLLRGWHAGW